jgi:hypothetical protein
MIRARASALALSCLCGSGIACHKPVEDPSEAAYGQAVARFAQLSAQTQDLTYRDPRFDEVLADLARIPADSEAGMRAAALVQHIRQGRTVATQADQKTAQALQQAIAAPGFVPERRAWAAPLAAPPNPTVDRPPVLQGAPLTASAGLPQPGAPAPLPDWYRQRGFLTDQPVAPSLPPPPPPGEEPVDVVAGAPDASASTSTPSPAPSNDGGRPHIFGLPGPAGRALGPP